MKDTVTVYWTYMTLPERTSRTSMLFEPPRPIMTTLPADGQDSSRKCYASQKYFKNTFVVKHPIDFDVLVYGQYPNMVIEPNNGILQPRESVYKDSLSFTYDYGWLFFSEESIDIVQTPPYMHNTETGKYASMPAGSFDISKWFRSVLPTYTLWDSNNTFKAKAGEPMFYIDFKTNKKVKLKQFEMTKEIFEIANACQDFKLLKPFTPLEELYKRFTSGKRNKQLIKLIKQNII